jgi:hypothetical protein
VNATAISETASTPSQGHRPRIDPVITPTLAIRPGAETPP